MKYRKEKSDFRLNYLSKQMRYTALDKWFVASHLDHFLGKR